MTDGGKSASLDGPVAIDAMGGDRAPEEIVAGALLAVDELGVEVLLAGPPERLGRLLPDSGPPAGVTLLPATEVVGMDDDPAAAIRRKRDSSLVRCAEAVRDGRAVAMVGAGNTGATMAAALLRTGRIRGVDRPAIAVPIPVPGATAQILVDGGATVDCTPRQLEQFARMGAAYARARIGVDRPSIGLLSNGEEPGKGDALRKEAHELLTSVPGFVGNVEGRDLTAGTVDVIVTDGFTGNVALKTLEGGFRTFAGLVLRVLDSTPEAKEAAQVLLPLLLAAAEELDPDRTGGAVLLGIRGVCVVSHGSSSARAIVNAVRVAADSVRADVVGRIEEAVTRAG